MFVYTFKFNKKLAVLILLALAAIICALVLLIGGSDTATPMPSSAEAPGAGSNSERLAYLENLGWQVSPEPIGEKNIIIPKQFSEIYKQYNELQLSCGYDLSGFCGMEATVYTYEIQNYKNYCGQVVADLYVRSGKLIGGDIHSLALDGFMHGLQAAK